MCVCVCAWGCYRLSIGGSHTHTENTVFPHKRTLCTSWQRVKPLHDDSCFTHETHMLHSDLRPAGEIRHIWVIFRHFESLLSSIQFDLLFTSFVVAQLVWWRRIRPAGPRLTDVFSTYRHWAAGWNIHTYTWIKPQWTLIWACFLLIAGCYISVTIQALEMKY